jgi:beta-glucosidase
MIDQHRDRLPRIESGDMKTIAAPLDFLGVNYYSRSVVQAKRDGNTAHDPLGSIVRPSGSEYTDMDWEVYPDGLYDLLLRVTRDYQPRRLYITENGAAYPDVPDHDGRVRDPERRRYLEQHFEAAGRAIRDGAPLAGHFVWSLMDNFEWGEGYAKRFGIVYIDYPTQRRVIKASGHWYASLLREFNSGQP